MGRSRALTARGADCKMVAMRIGVRLIAAAALAGALLPVPRAHAHDVAPLAVVIERPGGTAAADAIRAGLGRVLDLPVVPIAAARGAPLRGTLTIAVDRGAHAAFLELALQPAGGGERMVMRPAGTPPTGLGSDHRRRHLPRRRGRGTGGPPRSGRRGHRSVERPRAGAEARPHGGGRGARSVGGTRPGEQEREQGDGCGLAELGRRRPACPATPCHGAHVFSPHTYRRGRPPSRGTLALVGMEVGSAFSVPGKGLGLHGLIDDPPDGCSRI